MEQTIKPVMSRALSIDILRGFALVCMVLIHFMIYLGDVRATSTWFYFGFNHLLGDWGASCFLIIMGMSQVFSGLNHADLDRRLLFKRSLIRGVFIFITGLVMLILARGPSHVWQWDILTLIGLATLVLFYCRKFSSFKLLVGVLLIAVATPFLRGQLAIAPVWEENFVPVVPISNIFPDILFDPARELQVPRTIPSIIQGFLLTGEFPVFPWLLFPLAGCVLGRCAAKQKILKDLPFILVVGMAFVLLGLGLAYAGSLRPDASVISGYVAPLCFYPDSFSIIFIQLGLSMSLISWMYCVCDARRPLHQTPGKIAGYFIRISRSSLTFYFLHYLLIGWPLALIFLLTGKYLIYNLLSGWLALFSGIAAVIFLSLLLQYWQKRDGKFTLEWFLFVITRRLTEGSVR